MNELGMVFEIFPLFGWNILMVNVNKSNVCTYIDIDS